jgi:hypothetical protein
LNPNDRCASGGAHRPQIGSRIPAAFALLAMLALGACGKKGPPLAPLSLVPEAPSAVAAKRLGGSVYVQMVAPRKNANGPGVVALDHLDVFAVTVGPGFVMPPNRELLTPTYLVGRIDIKPPVDEDQAEPPSDETEKDTRPAAGDKVTFTEALTEKQLQSAPGLKAAPPPPAAAAAASAPGAPVPVPGAAAGTTTAPSAAGTSVPSAPPATASTPTAASPAPPTTAETPAPTTAAPQPPTAPGAATGSPTPPPAGAVSETVPVGVAPVATASTIPMRIYVIRGVTRKGRPGPASVRVSIPLVSLPPPPGNVTASYGEHAMFVSWLAPVADVGASPMTFNVYSTPSAPAQASQTAALAATPLPLNDAPLPGTAFEHPGMQPGVEQCFAVRTVQKVGDAVLESDASPSVCVTPRDTFPPAPPKGLAVVAMDGAVMNLIWDANTEPDMAGYLVLRGEAPGDTLQPLTPQPIKDTSYRDTTVKPGVRYVYAIVAIDRATPPNRSAPSARVEETAR